MMTVVFKEINLSDGVVKLYKCMKPALPSLELQVNIPRYVECSKASGRISCVTF